MHGQLEQLFVVLATLPAVLLHFLDVFGQCIGIGFLRHAGVELHALLFRQPHNFRCQFARQLAGTTQNHAPRILVYLAEAGFTLRHGQQVHHGYVLRILAEGGHQRRIAQHGPDIFHLLEQLHRQLLETHFRLAVLLQGHIDGAMHTAQVAHHRTHHAAGQTASHQQRATDTVTGVDIQAQEVIDELLRQLACLHVGVHVDVFHQESGILQHGLHRDDIGVHHAPRQRLHGAVDDVGTRLRHHQGRSHRETGTGMTVILHHNVGILGLDFMHQPTQCSGASHAGHILQADLVGTEFHQLVHNTHVVLYGVYGRVGDAQGRLADHAGLLGIFHAEFQIARVVQTAERAHDIHALRLLHLRHQSAHIGRHAIHAQAVQCTLQHVGLDASLVELLGPGAHRLVGVLAIHQVHLLESAAIGLYAVKATHLDNHRRYLHQLVHTGLVLARRLPHVAVHQTEFYLF